MFLLPVRVYYEDTDSGGVVYYANYLKFMERARTEWLRCLGFEQNDLAQTDGVIFAVRSATLDFLQPGRFNDLLCITAQLDGKGRASMTFTQQVFRITTDAAAKCFPSHSGILRSYDEIGGEKTLLCSGQVKIACVDAVTLRPRRIPEHLLMEINRDG